jgi:hypothetical protein
MSARLTKQFLAKFKESKSKEVVAVGKKKKRRNEQQAPPSKKQRALQSKQARQAKQKGSAGPSKGKKNFLDVAKNDKVWNDNTKQNIDAMLYRPKELDQKQDLMLAILKKTQGFVARGGDDDSDSDDGTGMFEF